MKRAAAKSRAQVITPSNEPVQAMNKRASTYESEALSLLAYEFPFTDNTETDRKIKGRLKRKKLGPFDAERIAPLRRLKDDLQEEIGKFAKSRYFTEPHGEYADIRDFDVLRLTTDMSERYPQIPRIEIESFVPFCVLVYYLL
jgi:hypothetical protein